MEMLIRPAKAAGKLLSDLLASSIHSLLLGSNATNPNLQSLCNISYSDFPVLLQSPQHGAGILSSIIYTNLQRLPPLCMFLPRIVPLRVHILRPHTLRISHGKAEIRNSDPDELGTKQEEEIRVTIICYP